MINVGIWQIVISVVVLLFLGGLIGGWIAILRSVVRASNMASRGASTLLEEAAEAVVAEPSQHWAAELLRLFKAVDIRADKLDYRPALEQVGAEIRVRLETGHWPEHRAPLEREQGENG
jgi:hypothetical protein